MSTSTLSMDLAESMNLLDRTDASKSYVNPEELHLSQPEGEILMFNVNSSSSSIQSPQDAIPAMPADTIGPESSTTSESSQNNNDGRFRPSKAYAPRASASGRKSTKASMRVRPKNGQHARELERNRQAAASYRSRQKNQLDSLLTRVREEEDKMLKQRSLVYSLKDELWQLRNQLMARQQSQIFASRNLDPSKRPFGSDPASNTAW